MLVEFIVRKGCPVVGRGRGEKFLEDLAVSFVGNESLAGFRCHTTSNLRPRVVAVVNMGWRSQTACEIFAVERIGSPIGNHYFRVVRTFDTPKLAFQSNQTQETKESLRKESEICLLKSDNIAQLTREKVS